MTQAHNPIADRAPLILTVPGLGNSGPGHWQTQWEGTLPHCYRVDLGLWEDPHRNTWVNKINLAVQRADRPVVLVAHSLGCLAVAWWAEFEQPIDGKVIGALLVAPPDVEVRPIDRRLTRFAPFPHGELSIGVQTGPLIGAQKGPLSGWRNVDVTGFLALRGVGRA